MKRIQMQCKRCGSTWVRRDADAVWNVTKQRWGLCAVYDHATCEQCEGETEIVEFELPDCELLFVKGD